MIDKDKVLEAMVAAMKSKLTIGGLRPDTDMIYTDMAQAALKAMAKALPECETSLDRRIFYDLIMLWGKDD